MQQHSLEKGVYPQCVFVCTSASKRTDWVSGVPLSRASMACLGVLAVSQPSGQMALLTGGQTV